MNGNIFFDGAKSPTITTNKGEGNKILGVLNPFNQRFSTEKTGVLTTGANFIVDLVQPSLSDRIYSEDNNKLLQIRIPEATKK